MMNDLGLDLMCSVDDFGDDMSDQMAAESTSPFTPLDTQHLTFSRYIRALEQENERLRRLVISLRIAA